MDAGVAGYIAGREPAPGVPAAAGEFARAVVAAAAPGNRERARCLLRAVGKLAARAIPLGMEPVPGTLPHPPVTGRWCRIWIPPASRTARAR